MEAVGKGLGIGIELLIELHGVPTVFAPPLPVLYDDAQRHPFIAETTGCLQNLIGGVETLTTMDITQCPLWHERRGTCEFTIGGDDLIGGADEDGIVYSIGYG